MIFIRAKNAFWVTGELENHRLASISFGCVTGAVEQG
jgi:hypothetical protein